MSSPIIIHHQHLVPMNIGGAFLPAPVTAITAAPTVISPIYSPSSPTSPVCSPQPMALSNYNMLINYSMELVWHGEFTRLFQHFQSGRWVLTPTFSLPKGRKWTMFKDSAKVRFLCQNCSHGWTSMKGRVVFWFTFDEQRNVGIVLFRLFGQRCQSCSPKAFEHAMWYPEEVVKVVGNIYNRIGQEYYGFYSPPVRIDRRAGKPRSQHNASLCQACAEGICPGEFDASVETFGLYKKTPMMPSSLSRSFSGSVSSQYSSDVGYTTSSGSELSSEELLSSETPSESGSERAYHETHSDTASDTSDRAHGEGDAEPTAETSDQICEANDAKVVPELTVTESAKPGDTRKEVIATS